MVVKVMKSDGDMEEYVHTKVLLCISNALCAADEWDACTAQELAEAVTAFVYEHKGHHMRSAEILSMVKLALTETGYAEAAVRLDEHHRRRSLARRRTEFVDADVLGPDGAEAVRAEGRVSQWSKRAIAEHIAETYGLDRHSARAAASRVEEKILAMGISRVWSGLVRQIVFAEAALAIRAGEFLQESPERDHAGQESCCDLPVMAEKVIDQPDVPLEPQAVASGT
ncbi:MAG TPA: hypothetical protein VLH60_04035 [Sedimentisphaerales bacterium]|nr:hypothetical protein [Sedimentisphaerales bacterium]